MRTYTTRFTAANRVPALNRKKSYSGVKVTALDILSIYTCNVNLYMINDRIGYTHNRIGYMINAKHDKRYSRYTIYDKRFS